MLEQNFVVHTKGIDSVEIIDKPDLVKSKIFCSSKDSKSEKVKASYRLEESPGISDGQRACAQMNITLPLEEFNDGYLPAYFMKKKNALTV